MSRKRFYVPLVAAMTVFFTAMLGLQAMAATIQTDLFVYQNGDTVTVTGEAFGPTEVVDVVTTTPSGTVVDHGTPATDEAGAFTYQFILNSDEAGLFDVVGSGEVSGLTASAQFDPAVNLRLKGTDGATSYTTSPGESLGNVTKGTPLSLNVYADVASIANNTTLDWTVSQISGPSVVLTDSSGTFSRGQGGQVSGAPATVGVSVATAGLTEGTNYVVRLQETGTSSSSSNSPINPQDYYFNFTVNVSPQIKLYPAPSDVVFYVTYRGYTNDTCTEGEGDEGAGWVSGANGQIISPLSGSGPLNGKSYVKFTAPVSADAPSGATFKNWSTHDPSDNSITLTAERSICVRIPSGGEKDAYDATYLAAPANQPPTDPGAPYLDAGSITPNNTGNFKVDWTASTDPDEGDTVTYELQKHDASTSTFTSVASGITTNSYTFSNESEGTYTYRVQASDNHGALSAWATDSSPIVVVDKTAPNAPTGSAGTPDYAGGGGWYRDSATVVWSANGDPNLADASAGSGVDASTVGPSDILTASGTATDTVFDNAGNESSEGSVGVQVDASAPTYDCGTLPTGWQSDNVTLNCTAEDTGSGLNGSSPASFQLATSVSLGDETAAAPTNSQQLCDNVGHCVTAGPYAFDVDRKAPQLTSCDAPDGNWHDGNVTLYCHYTDGGSGPATQVVDLTTNVAAGDETDNAAASANGDQACDTVGNCAVSPADITGNMVDRKAPQLDSCDLPDGLWHAGNVTLECTYTDGGSGPASQEVSLTTSVASGEETANAIASAGGAQACDAVNNCAVSPAGIAGNKVDRKAPSITINVPAAADYTLNQAVTSAYSCVDNGSGLALLFGCVGDVANGANIDTSTVGGHTFHVGALDQVANASNKEVAYRVLYSTGSCLGSAGHQVLQPVNADGSSAFKKGSTVPVKFRVCDANGISIGTPGVVSTFKLVKKVNGTVEETQLEIVVSTTPDTAFRWSSTDQQWIFNLNTKNLTAGYTYFYEITLNDGSVIPFNFYMK